MNNLWIFGDSFSSPFNLVRPDYNEYLGYEPKTFGNLISENFNLNLINTAGPGADNYTIFNHFINNIEKIYKEDILIFGWSDVVRFRFVNEENHWNSVLPAKKLPFWSNLSKKTVEEILINRTNKLYEEELNDYIKLINFTFKNNIIIHWAWLEYDIDLTLPNYSLPSINADTNGLINDGHYSERGHEILSENMIEYIKKKRATHTHNPFQ